jgi:hypothetical protein
MMGDDDAGYSVRTGGCLVSHRCPEECPLCHGRSMREC